MEKKNYTKKKKEDDNDIFSIVVKNSFMPLFNVFILRAYFCHLYIQAEGKITYRFLELGQ